MIVLQGAAIMSNQAPHKHSFSLNQRILEILACATIDE